ncbi:MAG: spore germination protein [Clostridiaceae bacterium]
MHKKKLSGNLSEDIKHFKELFAGSSDIVYREFKISNLYNAVLIFLDGFADINQINSTILRPLINYNVTDYTNTESNLSEINAFMHKQILSVAKLSTGVQFQEVIDHILSGETALLINGLQESLFIDIKKLEKREISEPKLEPLLRGPHDGFTEDLKTNIALIRKRIKTHKLKMEQMQIGRLTKTDIIITYIDGIANDSIVEEAKKRLSKIDIDGLLESEYIEELIEDNHFSIFSQFGYTERPDKLCADLLSGSIGIMINNTPIALIAPQTFIQSMEFSEDYYFRFLPATFLRIIRYIFLGIALLLPSFYIAILTFHPGMIAKPLLFTIWASREGVPFPVLVEAIIIETFFEVLREASLRVPSGTGQTIGIVGALVIGEAAVRAGIVSSSMVIIVSITGISSFMIPKYSLALSVRVLRFVMMIFSGTLGLYGLFMGLFTILIHMAKLSSFGVPYLSPLAPLSISDLKDVILRAPWWAMKKRPKFLGTKNRTRQK